MMYSKTDVYKNEKEFKNELGIVDCWAVEREWDYILSLSFSNMLMESSAWN